MCEIGDDGRITDPLAGRHPDSPDDDSGHGLRIAHELCNLVQLRSGPWGTTVRLHILARRRPATAATRVASRTGGRHDAAGTPAPGGASS